MSDILSRLKSVHDAATREKVHVEEYGLDMYFPPLTLALKQECAKGINPKDETALMVGYVHRAAEDEAGEKLFPQTGKEVAQVVAELHRMKFSTLLYIVQASGGETVSKAALAEIQAVEIDALRAGMASALDGAAPELAAAIEAAGEGRLRDMLRDLCAAHQSGVPAKNA